ncbi:GNAT family N-acetyltransferase [Dactylosporangium vinaceum]|uniref:GNAT family N-acetyltransferase n=1 Tax=Dactylosporangium vinaceum TaxID=53362 RepID=A0ABV5M8W2_9ACTN|nr:GNAT family N-acetyltransferase [Dactylosporangium vinaceum]UAB99514.1 GNAT family N-acetyltransferase [Dactylosporangium vinaceum]
MPELSPPVERVHESFLAAMAEFRAEGRGVPDDNSMIGHDLRTYGDTWADPDTFARYVADTRAQALEETPRPEHFVPSTTLWLIDGDEYLGRVAIRHRLNQHLLDEGGHIGYDVRPTARRRGHATAMLRGALIVAKELGIEPALLTCDTTNTVSRRVIEAAGGVLEDERNGKLRFWVPVG